MQDRALELDSRLIYTKGDNHTVMNNVAWDDNDDSQCTICVPSELKGIPMNAHTVVVNNGAQKFQGLICFEFKVGLILKISYLCVCLQVVEV